MSYPIIPPFAIAASYQNSQYATGTYTQGGSQVFSHLVSPPTSGVAAETAADTDAHDVGFDVPASHSEVQVITISGTPAAGTWTATLDGATTSPIAYNATNTTVQTALQGLTSVGSGNVTVTGSAGGPYTLTFGSKDANINIDTLTVDGSGLRKATVVVTTQTAGVSGGSPVNEVQVVTLTAATGGTFKLTFGGQTTGAIAYNAAASAVQAALQALSSIGTNNATVTGSAGGPYTVTFVGTLAATDVAQMTATNNLTASTTPTIAVSTTTQGFAYGNPALLNQTRQHDSMRDFYDTAGGNHF